MNFYPLRFPCVPIISFLGAPALNPMTLEAPGDIPPPYPHVAIGRLAKASTPCLALPLLTPHLHPFSLPCSLVLWEDSLAPGEATWWTTQCTSLVPTLQTPILCFLLFLLQ